MRKTILMVAVLALALIGVTAPANAGDQLRGFHGNMVGAATFEPTTDPTCTELPFKTVTTAAGTVAHLGPVTMESLHCSGNNLDGTMVLTGKHGTLTLDYAGPCTPFVPGVTTLVECDLDFTVVGGTDRYDGAGGSGHIAVTVVPQPDPTPWPATFAMHGRIAY
jgi:hypothetical protein